MSIIAFLVLGIYTFALLYVTVYCLMQFNLLYHYKKHKNDEPEHLIEANSTSPKEEMVLAEAGGIELRDTTARAGTTSLEALPEQEWPFVTVQLPIYNELYVIERLIDNITQFDYPKDRFEIHILDDSNDETLEVTRRKVEEYKAKGFQIEQIIREKRQGFKAGALRDAMPFAKGEFIAIFDADFLPHPDFLKNTIPHFKDKKVGVVQTRWEHINQEYSLITKLQAIQLNVHFTVEQAGRMRGDYLLQFNGTAGVWRRETIEDAGGWEADTLTEDLDLSIRAQLKGWKINFLEQIASPAELPAEMNSLKSQQFRWMKGGAETAKKMLPTVWRSNLSARQKIQATSHLLSSSVFLFVFIMGVISVPLLFYLGDLIAIGFDRDYFAIFLVGLLSIVAVYYVANVQAVPQGDSFGKSLFKFLILFPLFLALSMGLSLHNSVAVIQGYWGKQSPFVRTPKFNIKSLRDSFTRNKYVIKKLSWTTILEGLLALYFIGAVIGGWYLDNMTFIVFHFMLALGYGTIFYFSLRHLSLK
jgi:cellulose synthase/poly-beta-1,6-N-acetylglucosamine synthase-like glycosyltransferase